jgi:hypothetical protein
MPGRPLAFARGDLLWQPVRPRLPPGNHNTPEGSIYVFPIDAPPMRYLQVEVKNNEKTLTPLTMDGTVVQPKPVKRTPFAARRQTRVSLELHESLPIDHVLLPHDGSPIRVASRGIEVIPVHSVVENLYFRGNSRKREKVLNRLILSDVRPTADIHTSLSHFDRLFSVDTNTYMVGAQRVLITSICWGAVTPVAGSGSSLSEYHHLRTFLTHSSTADAEAIGWWTAFDFVQSVELAPSSHRLLVVDANLSLLDAFNRRETPLPTGEFLPPGWQLMYATSDAGTQEFLPNQMLAAAHQASGLAFRHIKKEGLPPEWPAS